MKTALNVIIRMIIVIGVLLMLAFDQFPEDKGITKKNFLLMLAGIAFLYYFAQLSRTSVQQPIVVNTVSAPARIPEQNQH